MSFLDHDIGATTGPKIGSLRTDGLYTVSFKQAFDILVVFLLLPIVVPLIALMALIVACDGGGSCFYSQQRVGRGGRNFRMWKLRTMVPDADRKLKAHLAANPAARAEWDLKQKLADDPRITRVGHILRKTSLDELPQLWNVLIGEMSLVGPRPMMVHQKPLYPGRAYFAMRPGITGPWQVSDRNATSFAARAEFDRDYYRKMSFAGDMDLLIRTIRVVLRGTGC